MLGKFSESILKIHLQIKHLLIAYFEQLHNDTQAHDYTIYV